MTVQVWVGEKPESANERRAIMLLAEGLERLDNLYLLLANFSVGGRTIDLVVIKQDAIFITELKHCNGKVFGGVNGPWFVESGNGVQKALNAGRKNPYNQVISYYYGLTNFLHSQRNQILTSARVKEINFRACRRVIVIAPCIQEGSKLELDWKVEAKGLDQLPAFLLMERSAEINLTETEMLAIPKLLGCTRWKEVEELAVGPSVSAGSAPETVEIAKEAVEIEAVNSPLPSPAQLRQPKPIWAKFRHIVATGILPVVLGVKGSLSVISGRLLLGAAVVTLGILAAFLLIPSFAPPNLAEKPQFEAVNRPAGGVLLDEVSPNNAGCVWAGFQPVGKRWDNTARTWISVGVNGTGADLIPDLVVTLEQVFYCGKQITLTWSLQNKSKAPVRFPLQQENVQINDPLGNAYLINDSLSQPSVLLVEAGKQAHGVVVVPWPVRQNAPSLLVRLKNEPFGEASWLVALEGN